MNQEAEKQLKVLQLISFALVTGVVLFAVIIVFLIDQGANSTAPIEVPMEVIAGVGLVTLLAAPRVGAALRNRKAAGDEEAVQNFFNSVVVAQALREGVGLAGIVLAFVTGELMWALVFAVVSAGTMLAGMPRKSEMAESIKEQRRG